MKWPNKAKKQIATATSIATEMKKLDMRLISSACIACPTKGATVVKPDSRTKLLALYRLLHEV
jgi:hypothetical protein